VRRLGETTQQRTRQSRFGSCKNLGNWGIEEIQFLIRTQLAKVQPCPILIQGLGCCYLHLLLAKASSETTSFFFVAKVAGHCIKPDLWGRFLQNQLV
jgi:hypothetical protein